jgi:multiple sugar transport system permease protein
MNVSGRKITSSALRYLFLLGLLFFSLFPIYWMVSMSFKPQIEWISTTVLWLPRDPTLLNWMTLFVPKGQLQELGLIQAWEQWVPQTAVRSIANSLVLGVGGTVLSMFIGTTAAYSMSRYKAGGNFMPYLFLTFRMLPPVAILMPIVIWFATLRIIDNYFGMFLLYGLFPVPFVIWLMRSFFEDVPKEIDEAALIDGCTPAQVFSKVIFPLVRAGFFVTALFIFILNWSDFVIAIVMTGRHTTTIPVQMGIHSTANIGINSALGVIAIIPTLAFGLLVQKHLIRGLTFGAIKD